MLLQHERWYQGLHFQHDGSTQAGVVLNLSIPCGMRLPCSTLVTVNLLTTTTLVYSNLITVVRCC